MTRPYYLKLVTATALATGETVYLTADDQWTKLPHDAELIDDEAHGQLRLLHATAQRRTVAGAYLGDARLGAAGPEPVQNREAFRTHEAADYRYGKQAGTRA